MRKNLRRAAASAEAAASLAAAPAPGPSTVSQIILRCLRLLLVPTGAVQASYESLSGLLRVTPGRLAVVLRRCPALLLRGPEELRGRWLEQAPCCP